MLEGVYCFVKVGGLNLHLTGTHAMHCIAYNNIMFDF